MDITESLAPKSDQLDAIELIGGPRTFTIGRVTAGSDEQPIDVELLEFPRVWRPSKGMRRLLAAGWGVNAKTWEGHRLTLFFDPNVSFGKERTGGTRISHMSDLPGGKAIKVPLLVKRGQSSVFTVDPLPDAPTQPTAEQVAACTDPAELRTWWKTASGETRTLIQARGDALLAIETSAPEGDDRSDEYLALMADES
jgi:hypothetical protein